MFTRLRLASRSGSCSCPAHRGGYALKIAGVERGQAVLMGTIREADTPTILVLRLGISGQQISKTCARLENGSVTAGDPVRVLAFAFKIENGEIGPVESVLHQVPYGMGSGGRMGRGHVEPTTRVVHVQS